MATTGTHDHEPLAEWYDQLPAEERHELVKIPGLRTLRERGTSGFDDGVREALLELVYQTPSELVLLPFQDLFGARERINLPGTVNVENWSYRMPTSIAELTADQTSNARLAGLANRSGRGAGLDPPTGRGEAGASDDDI